MSSCPGTWDCRPQVRGEKQILTVPVRLGIEGLVTFKREIQFDADNYTITIPAGGHEVAISVFDKVKVMVEVEQDKNTTRGRVVMTLSHPVDSRAL